MAVKRNMGNKVRDYLGGLDPLTPLRLDDLYRELVELEDDDNQVRYQLYRHSVGTPVAIKNPPQQYFAIRLKLPDVNKANDYVFLSLPGVGRQQFLEDNDPKLVDDIIKKLQAKYGNETIRYWGGAAQRRSVDFISSTMRAAKERSDGKCVICELIQSKESDTVPLLPIRASHIVSRKVVFWKVVRDVEEQDRLSIFSDEGVNKIRERIKSDELHSDPRFIVGLCIKHDRLLQQTLKTVTQKRLEE